MASAMRNSASERSDGVVSRHVSNAVAAACMARSTSARPDSGAVAYCSPSRGRSPAWSAPSAASTRLPLMKFEKAFMVRLYHASATARRSRALHLRSVAMTAAIRTVGVPSEIKTAEHRVAMTPDGVRELERTGSTCSSRPVPATAPRSPTPTTSPPAPTIVPTAEDAWAQEMVVKVKEPMDAELGFLRQDLVAVHVPPPRRLPGRRQGVDRRRDDRPGLRDRAAGERRRCRCWRR